MLNGPCSCSPTEVIEYVNNISKPNDLEISFKCLPATESVALGLLIWELQILESFQSLEISGTLLLRLIADIDETQLGQEEKRLQNPSYSAWC